MAAMPPGTITPHNNAESRLIWWSQPGNTLDRVLEHIRRTFDEDGKRKEKKRRRRASPVPLAVVRPDDDDDGDATDNTLAVVVYTGDAGQSSSNAPGKN